MQKPNSVNTLRKREALNTINPKEYLQTIIGNSHHRKSINDKTLINGFLRDKQVTLNPIFEKSKT